MRFKLCLETAADSIACGIHGVLFSVDIWVLDASSCGICNCLVRCARGREAGQIKPKLCEGQLEPALTQLDE